MMATRHIELGHGVNNNGYINTSGAVRLDFRHNSNIRMSILDNGNVGIGTTEPEALLDVAGDFKLQQGATINEISADSTMADNSDGAVPTERAIKGYVDNQINAIVENDPQVGSNTTDYLSKWDGNALVQGSIYDNGKIGIGTTNPTAKLHVNGKVNVEGVIRGINENDADRHIELGHGVNNNGYINTSGAVRLDFRNNSNTRMSILDNGNIGISTTEPEALLDVAGDFKLENGTKVNEISTDQTLG